MKVTAQQVLSHLNTCGSPFQLVRHCNEVHSKHKVYPTTVEVKYDGVFCAVVVGEGKHYCVSRTGKLFFNPINSIMYPQVPSEDGVWIGELINKRCSLEVLSGLLSPNRVKPWTEEEADLMRSADIIFHDALTLGEAHQGFALATQSVRFKRLPWYVYTVDSKVVTSEEELLKYAAEVIAKGGEGICIKNPAADYEAGHKGWRVMKIVRDLHIDLRCVAVKMGNKGKRYGQIAKLQFKYNNKLFWADLGAGWTDDKRIALTIAWQKQTELDPLWKVFHVKALQESSKGVLRLPKVMEMRIDKDTEDTV